MSNKNNLYRKDKFVERNTLKNAALISFRNARELYEDAELLFNSGRYARAAYLSFIGIEEIGKSCLCSFSYDHNIKISQSDFLKFWRTHAFKLLVGYGGVLWSADILEKIMPKELLPKRFKNWFDYEKEREEFYFNYARLSSDIKLASLYCDVSIKEINTKFSLPSISFTLKRAKYFLDELLEKIEKLGPEVDKMGRVKISSNSQNNIYE